MLNEKSSFTNTYNPGDLLTFTLNPKDGYQHFGTNNRFNTCRNNLNRLFMESMPADDIPYWAKLELSEPINEIKWPGSRIHMHGFIYLKNENSVFLFLSDVQYFLSDLGILKINHCKTQQMRDDWIRYIEVQRPIFKNKCRLISSIATTEFPIEYMNARFPEPSAERSTLPSPSNVVT